MLQLVSHHLLANVIQDFIVNQGNQSHLQQQKDAQWRSTALKDLPIQKCAQMAITKIVFSRALVKNALKDSTVLTESRTYAKLDTIALNLLFWKTISIPMDLILTLAITDYYLLYKVLS